MYYHSINCVHVELQDLVSFNYISFDGLSNEKRDTTRRSRVEVIVLLTLSENN